VLKVEKRSAGMPRPTQAPSLYDPVKSGERRKRKSARTDSLSRLRLNTHSYSGFTEPNAYLYNLIPSQPPGY